MVHRKAFDVYFDEFRILFDTFSDMIVLLILVLYHTSFHSKRNLYKLLKDVIFLKSTKRQQYSYNGFFLHLHLP